MPTITLNKTRFDSSCDNETILDSAEKNGVFFPYSCKVGRCSSCKCKVLSGETVVTDSELGISEIEKSNGWILGCVRRAITDIELYVENLVNVDLILPKMFPCKISQINKLSSDVLQIILRLPPSAKFLFYAGQYVDVCSGGGDTRSYSVANFSAKKNHIELHIKNVPGGVLSDYWFEEAKIDDLLRIKGPLGTFFLRDISGKDVVFLATGTGIAPVKAMLEGLKGLAKEAKPKSVTVYWGARTSHDLYLSDLHDNTSCQYVPVLSRPPSTWRGSSGYVQDIFMASSPDFSQTVVYACGSDVMIKSAQNLLSAAGLSMNDFFSDAFVASSPN